jgi:hypothetical protein
MHGAIESAGRNEEKDFAKVESMAPQLVSNNVTYSVGLHNEQTGQTVALCPSCLWGRWLGRVSASTPLAPALLAHDEPRSVTDGSMVALMANRLSLAPKTVAIQWFFGSCHHPTTRPPLPIRFTQGTPRTDVHRYHYRHRPDRLSPDHYSPIHHPAETLRRQQASLHFCPRPNRLHLARHPQDASS